MCLGISKYLLSVIASNFYYTAIRLQILFISLSILFVEENTLGR